MANEKELTLTIQGMHCAGCVNRVTAALNKVAGVTVRQVTVGEAKIAIHAATSPAPNPAAAIEKIGFHVTGVQE